MCTLCWDISYGPAWRDTHQCHQHLLSGDDQAVHVDRRRPRADVVTVDFDISGFHRNWFEGK